MAEDLDVLGGAGDGQPHLLGEGIDVAGALSQEIEDLEAFGVSERLPHAGELPIDAVFEEPMVIHEPEYREKWRSLSTSMFNNITIDN